MLEVDAMGSLRLIFDRGTLLLEGAGAEGMAGAVWDPRVAAYRCAAHRYARHREWADAAAVALDDRVAPALATEVSAWRTPSLSPYQQDALRAFHAFGSRGVCVLPTGSGKTIVAVAALAHARAPTLVLCPTRALLEQWVALLGMYYSGPIGIVGDGARRVEPVTVMTFESAYRCLDRYGAHFRVLVVDEVHHFSGGIRAEALEMSVAPIRLGLTATAPEAGSAAEACLRELVGPIVCEMHVDELAGTHLAELESMTLRVRLDPDEAVEYARLRRPFLEARRALVRAHPGLDWESLVRAIAQSSAGRAALAHFQRASALASFPRAKRASCAQLLSRHRGDKCLVFTGSVDDAYRVALEHLVPVLSADTGRAERTETLERFRDGRYRTLVSARVLNEGIDVPDARIAIVIAGRLGVREHVQRIGRVLRPAPGKRALLYELVTAGTVDDARARARRRPHAAGAPARV